MIAIITARRGSKRCLGKNEMTFIELDGRKYTIIDLALDRARLLEPERIILTTDLSLKIPSYVDYLKRDPYLCGDDVTSEDVVMDVLDKYECDSFCLMQPTTPVPDLVALHDANITFATEGLPALVSINPAYKPNGQFYFCRTDVFREEKTFFPEGCAFWMTDWRNSVDIDYIYDFRVAQAFVGGLIYGDEDI